MKVKQCIFLYLVCIFWFKFCKCNVPYYVNWIINRLNLVKFFPHFILLFNFENCTELTWAWAAHAPLLHINLFRRKKYFLYNFCFLNIQTVSPSLVFYHGVCFKNGFNQIIHQILKIYSCLHYEYNLMLMLFIPWTFFCNIYKYK